MTRAEFNDLVMQMSRKLYGVAWRILNNREEAEDAVQEVFIRLWKMGDKADSYDSIEALVTTMLKNHCIDLLRSRKRRMTEESGKQVLSIPGDHSPFEILDKKESEEIIARLINRLPDNGRQVVRLREIEGLSYEEIAVITGQNVNALRVTISRSRKWLRDEFNRYHYEHKGTEQAS
jgi:RNA polymerase sigma-70 factor, ECF subfamily